MGIRSVGACGAALAAGLLSGPAWGQDTAQLQKELDELRAEVAAMKAQQGESWLNQQRTEEVRRIVKDVLAEAESHKSFTGGGVIAGHDGRGFFLASDDGKFYLNIWGHFQFRYIANSRSSDSATDSGYNGGFQLRRSKIGFEGYVGDPRVDYRILLAPNRDSGAVELEDAWLRFAPAEDVRIAAGQFQDVIGREQMGSSKRLLAVERTAVANIFLGGDDFTQGVGAGWRPIDWLMVSGSVNDGINSALAGPSPSPINNNSFNMGNDYFRSAAQVAFSGRVDVKLAGRWSGAGGPLGESAEVADFTGTPTTALIGAGVHYEIGKTGDSNTAAFTNQTGPYDDFIVWTVDGQLKSNGLGLAAAFYGWHFDLADGNFRGGTLDNYAATVQAAYQVIPDTFEPFIEYEWISMDRAVTTANTPGTNNVNHGLNLITGGFNWYFKRQSLKFTADVVYALNNINSANTMGVGLSGLGLMTDQPGKSDQVVGRVQVQLLF